MIFTHRVFSFATVRRQGFWPNPFSKIAAGQTISHSKIAIAKSDWFWTFYRTHPKISSRRRFLPALPAIGNTHC